MNKKELYLKKIEILKKYIEKKYDLETMKTEQEKNKEVLILDYSLDDDQETNTDENKLNIKN